MEVRQDVEWVLRGGLWLAGVCHGTPAPPDWPPPTLTNPNKAVKCHSVPPTFPRQTAIN